MFCGHRFWLRATRRGWKGSEFHRDTTIPLLGGPEAANVTGITALRSLHWPPEYSSMAFFARLLQGLPIRASFASLPLHSDIDVPAIDVAAVADTLALLGSNQALEHRTNEAKSAKLRGVEQTNAAMQALFLNPLGDYEGRPATL